MLLKSGMNLNLVTGQVFLTQNIGGESGSEDTSSENVTTDTQTTDTQVESEGSSEAADGVETEEESISGETATDSTVTDEGEILTDSGEIAEDGSVITSDGTDMGMDGSYDEMYAGMESVDGTQVKDPLLSNWFFVIGISAATLVVSVFFGILLAKKRIKKGIELYED